MKKTICAIALVLSTATAFATDTSSIPSRTNPIAPVGGSLVEPKMWVGVNAGISATDGINSDAPWSVGAVAGYNVVRLGPLGLGIEGTYDYKKGVTQDISGNVLASLKFGSFSPYGLAGIGYRWADVKNEKTWTVGGGVKYAVSRNIEVDTRYRRIEDWDRARPDDRVTIGVNFKF